MATKLAKNAKLKSKLGKVAEKRDALRRRHAHHNISGKNAYAERRSQMNKDSEIDAEIAAELGTNLAIELEKVAGGNDETIRHGGQDKGHAGSSHCNESAEKVVAGQVQLSITCT